MSKFIKETNYNGDTKNQMWMSMISDGHDIFCGCNAPFAHLLDSIFPEGHKDRNKPISYIINRDYQQCHSGGTEEESSGMAVGTSAATILKEEKQDQDTTDENIEDLLAAVADAEKR